MIYDSETTSRLQLIYDNVRSGVCRMCELIKTSYLRVSVSVRKKTSYANVQRNNHVYLFLHSLAVNITHVMFFFRDKREYMYIKKVAKSFSRPVEVASFSDLLFVFPSPYLALRSLPPTCLVRDHAG